MKGKKEICLNCHFHKSKVIIALIVKDTKLLLSKKKKKELKMTQSILSQYQKTERRTHITPVYFFGGDSVAMGELLKPDQR